jgi:hypothetical protein
MDLASITLDVHQQIEISAAIGDVYDGLLRRLTDNSRTPDGKPLPLVLERWPGGRWFRDLESGTGHLWGFVQVIKPPTLLEIEGPLFMSYAAMNHVQFRLEQISGGTQLTLHHRALGLIDDYHRQGINVGWAAMLEDIKKRSE